MGIAKSHEAMADADVVVVVVDAVVGMSAEDEALLAGLSGRSYLVVWNKSDLVAVEVGSSGVRASALTGDGIAELRGAVLALVSGGAVSSSQAMVTNLRQQQAVTTAIAALVRAGIAVSAMVPHEMVLLDLYEGLQALDSLTGATTSDDVLHLIFSKFCIGK